MKKILFDTEINGHGHISRKTVTPTVAKTVAKLFCPQNRAHLKLESMSATVQVGDQVIVRCEPPSRNGDR